MVNVGSGLPHILAQLDATTQHPFLPSLSLSPVSDLRSRPMAFSAFPASLAIFLMGLSANKSLAHLTLCLLLGGPGITQRAISLSLPLLFL